MQCRWKCRWFRHLCVDFTFRCICHTDTQLSHTAHTAHTTYSGTVRLSRCVCAVSVWKQTALSRRPRNRLSACVVCVLAVGEWASSTSTNSVNWLATSILRILRLAAVESHLSEDIKSSWKSGARRQQQQRTDTTNNKNTSNNIRDQNHFSHFFVVVVFACRLFWLWWEPCVEPCEIHTFFVIPIRRQYFSIVLFHSFATDTQSRAVIASQTALAAAAKQFCSDRVSASKWK